MEINIFLPTARYGPGYYQCTRFCHMSRLMIANSWPTEYTLKFKADKDIYLLGACVTETDRQFYSPKLKYVLKLKDSAGNIMSDGSETFIKKTSNKIEGACF